MNGLQDELGQHPGRTLSAFCSVLRSMKVLYGDSPHTHKKYAQSWRKNNDLLIADQCRCEDTLWAHVEQPQERLWLRLKNAFKTVLFFLQAEPQPILSHSYGSTIVDPLEPLA